MIVYISLESAVFSGGRLRFTWVPAGWLCFVILSLPLGPVYQPRNTLLMMPDAQENKGKYTRPLEV
jgi:hypothetical protein